MLTLTNLIALISPIILIPTIGFFITWATGNQQLLGFHVSRKWKYCDICDHYHFHLYCDHKNKEFLTSYEYERKFNDS